MWLILRNHDKNYGDTIKILSLHFSIGADFQSYLILYSTVHYLFSVYFNFEISFHFNINSGKTERLTVNYSSNLQKIAYVSSVFSF